MAERVASICAECGAPVSFPLGTLQAKCDHCDGGFVVEKGAHLVRLGCPRCGGNFYYVDGSMCGHCPYCDASLLAICRDRVLRYVVRPVGEAPAGATEAVRVLLPFWHLSGLIFSWSVGNRVELVEDAQGGGQNPDGRGAQEASRPIRRDSGPQKVFGGRVLDISLPDPTTLALGVTSLRLRGAVFPLEPFAAEHEALGRVVGASTEARAARELLLARAMALSAPAEGLTRVDCRRFDLVAESLALIYYPFWSGRNAEGKPALWGGVNGEPEPLAAASGQPAARGSTIFDEMRVVELSCSACGATLAGGNRATVVPCRSCGRVFEVSRDGLVPFEARFARPLRQARDLLWLPFWQVRAEISYIGKPAARAADVRDVLGVLKAPTDLPVAPPDAPLCYFVPAYGAMRAPRIDYAARDMTRIQPLLEAGPAGSGEAFNCFLSARDARDLAYATWMLVIPGVALPRVRSLRVRPGAVTLWYVPFEDAGREIVSLVTGLRYDRDAFRGVRH